VSSLQTADNVDWSLVSSEEADAGMRENEYYFSVTIPRDFSQRVSWLSGDSPQKADIVLTANESANYITTQISSTLAGEVAASVSKEITTAFIDESLTGIEKLRVAIVDAAAATKKLAKGAARLSEGMDQLASGTSSLAAGAGEVATGNAALAKAATQAATFADNASAAGDRLVDDLAAGAQQVNAGSQELSAGAGELASALAKGASQIPGKSPEQIKELAKVAADPVGVQTININAVQANGSAMFADFVGLALWVGMLIGFTLLNPLPPRPLMSARTPTLCAVLVSYLPVAVIGMA